MYCNILGYLYHCFLTSSTPSRGPCIVISVVVLQIRVQRHGNKNSKVLSVLF